MEALDVFAYLSSKESNKYFEGRDQVKLKNKPVPPTILDTVEHISAI